MFTPRLPKHPLLPLLRSIPVPQEMSCVLNADRFSMSLSGILSLHLGDSCMNVGRLYPTGDLDFSVDMDGRERSQEFKSAVEAALYELLKSI